MTAAIDFLSIGSKKEGTFRHEGDWKSKEKMKNLGGGRAIGRFLAHLLQGIAQQNHAPYRARIVQDSWGLF